MSFSVETHVRFGTSLHGIHFSGSQGSRRFNAEMLVLRAHPKRLARYTRRHESLLGPNLLDNITLVGKGQEARGRMFQEHSRVMDERASDKEGQYEDL
jgi:hypothetical protein